MRSIVALVLSAGLVSIVLVAGCTGEEAAPVSSGGTTTSSAAQPAATEPTGVPGLDDADRFCAAWAVYAGTVQTLSVAAAFGDLDDVALTRLEVVSVPALLQSLAAIESEWPAAIVDERPAVFAGSLGGWRERSASVLDQLRAQGVGDDEAADTADAWRLVLARRSADQPVPPDPELRPAVWQAVDGAVVAVLADVGVFSTDPGLRRPQAVAPRTGAYLAATCPDLASSGVGDAL